MITAWVILFESLCKFSLNNVIKKLPLFFGKSKYELDTRVILLFYSFLIKKLTGGPNFSPLFLGKSRYELETSHQSDPP